MIFYIKKKEFNLLSIHFSFISNLIYNLCLFLVGFRTKDYELQKICLRQVIELLFVNVKSLKKL